MEDNYLTSEKVRREHRTKCVEKFQHNFEKKSNSKKFKILKENKRSNLKNQLWKEIDDESED